MHMLDDHENAASSRCMIAMLVSDPEGYTQKFTVFVGRIKTPS